MAVTFLIFKYILPFKFIHFFLDVYNPHTHTHIRYLHYSKQQQQQHTIDKEL